MPTPIYGNQMCASFVQDPKNPIRDNMKLTKPIVLSVLIFLSGCGSVSDDLATEATQATTASVSEDAASDVEASSSVGPLETELEAHVWTVTAMPIGFTTDTNIDRATVFFAAADQTNPAPRIFVESVCEGPGRGSLVEFSDDGFTVLPWPPADDEEIIGLGVDCVEDDDLTTFLDADGKIDVSISDGVALLTHATFELELTRTDSPVPTDSTSVEPSIAPDVATTVPE